MTRADPHNSPATAGNAHEAVLYQAHPVMFRRRPFAFLLCLVLSPVGLGLVILGVWWLRCRGTTLTLTSRRSILQLGLFGRNLREVWHADVCDFVLRQTFWQRMGGVGDVGISTAAESGFEIQAAGLPGPDRIEQIINRYRRAQRAHAAT
jgi:hypothetical protein